jgi:hypothetical protein
MDELTGLAQVWNRLAADMPLRTWEWNSTWWHHYQGDGQLYLLCVTRHGGASFAFLAPAKSAPITRPYCVSRGARRMQQPR